jgi:hypothetical protein
MLFWVEMASGVAFESTKVSLKQPNISQKYSIMNQALYYSILVPSNGLNIINRRGAIFSSEVYCCSEI